MKCVECKHFAQFGAQTRWFPLGECRSEAFSYGYRDNATKVRRDAALIENDEGWAWFVGPEFGCVHFEQKEKQSAS